MKVKHQEDGDSVPLSKVWWHEKVAVRQVAVRNSFLQSRYFKPLKGRPTYDRHCRSTVQSQWKY